MTAKKPAAERRIKGARILFELHKAELRRLADAVDEIKAAATKAKSRTPTAVRRRRSKKR